MLPEIVCLATLIWFECRGCELEVDRVAVAHVALNRANDQDGEFRNRNNICEVISQPGHFPWYGRTPEIRNSIDRIAWKNAKSIAKAVYYGYTVDPTEGALWFHGSHVRYVWSRGLEPVSVGSEVHVFWKQ